MADRHGITLSIIFTSGRLSMISADQLLLICPKLLPNVMKISLKTGIHIAQEKIIPFLTNSSQRKLEIRHKLLILVIYFL